MRHNCKDEPEMNKRKMSCQILHLENLAKCVNKLWYWYPDKLLSQGTGNGKRNVYWSNKLIFKSKSGFHRLIASYTGSKFTPLGKSSTYTYAEISPPKPLKPFCFTWQEVVTLDFNNHTVCQRPGILDYLTEASSQTPYWHIKQQHVQTKQCKRKAKLTLVGWAHP